MKVTKILIPFILTSFLSCNKKEAGSVDTKYQENEYEIAIVNFPDTIYVNKTYKGTITYTSTFDNIIYKLNTHYFDISIYIMFIYFPPFNLDTPINLFIKAAIYTTFSYKLP